MITDQEIEQEAHNRFPNAIISGKPEEINFEYHWSLRATENRKIFMDSAKWVISKLSGGMRGWVKASERLPKPSELGFFKENITCKWITESGKLISGMRSAEGVAYNKLDPTFYWLDESDQIAGSEKYALDAVILIKQILRDDVHIILGDLIDNAVNKALKPQPITNLKTAEEVLKPFIEIPFRYTRIVSEENALKAMEIYLNQSKGISPDNIDGIIRRTHES